MSAVEISPTLKVKQGRVRLIKDLEAFKNSFARFVGGSESKAWHEMKQTKAGHEGNVVEIYFDKTFTIEFDDGAECDCPFETVEAQLSLAYLVDVQLGRARLLSDPETFKNSFDRFEGDDENGWSDAKQLRVGQEGNIIVMRLLL